MTDPVANEEQFRALAVEALDRGDGMAAYRWAKGWIGGGGGAWITDPWLVYAASSLLLGHPRTAVHSLDLALRHWIHEPADRAVLRWARGTIVRRRLGDPKAALSDLAVAAADAPAWLSDYAARDRVACSAEADASRKRKPSVEPAPAYLGPGTVGEKVARSSGGPRAAGSMPEVWDPVVRHLA